MNTAFFLCILCLDFTVKAVKEFAYCRFVPFAVNHIGKPVLCARYDEKPLFCRASLVVIIGHLNRNKGVVAAVDKEDGNTAMLHGFKR